MIRLAIVLDPDALHFHVHKMLTSLLGIGAVCTWLCASVDDSITENFLSLCVCVCNESFNSAVSYFWGTTHLQPSQATYSMQWHHHEPFALHCISKRNGQYGVDMTRANKSDMHGHCFSRIGCLPCAFSRCLPLFAEPSTSDLSICQWKSAH